LGKKVKTSIYVDRDLWEQLKRHAMKRGVDVSSLIEEMIEEISDETLDRWLSELIDHEDYVLDFEPIKARGIVSSLVREMRDDRRDRLLG